jgi:holin-like protein
MVVMVFVFAGEILGVWIPLPIAGSIYGLVLLLLALIFKVVPLSWVEDAADFLHSFMALFFIVPAVAVIQILSELGSIWIYLGLTLAVTYLVVMASTGWIAQFMIKRSEKRGKHV